MTAKDHDILLRLEGKVDNFIKSQTDHEKRIRKVEYTSMMYKGAIAVLVFLAGIIEPVLWSLRGGNGK